MQLHRINKSEAGGFCDAIGAISLLCAAAGATRLALSLRLNFANRCRHRSEPSSTQRADCRAAHGVANAARRLRSNGRDLSQHGPLGELDAMDDENARQCSGAAPRRAPRQSAWRSCSLWLCVQLQRRKLRFVLLGEAVCRAASLSSSRLCAGCDSVQHWSCCSSRGQRCTPACFLTCARTVTTEQRRRACLKSREIEMVACWQLQCQSKHRSNRDTVEQMQPWPFQTCMGAS